MSSLAVCCQWASTRPSLACSSCCVWSPLLWLVTSWTGGWRSARTRMTKASRGDGRSKFASVEGKEGAEAWSPRSVVLQRAGSAPPPWQTDPEDRQRHQSLHLHQPAPGGLWSDLRHPEPAPSGVCAASRTSCSGSWWKSLFFSAACWTNAVTNVGISPGSFLYSAHYRQRIHPLCCRRPLCCCVSVIKHIHVIPSVF